MTTSYYAIIKGNNKYIETDLDKIDVIGNDNCHTIIKRFGKKNQAELFLNPKKKEIKNFDYLPMLNATQFFVHIHNNKLYIVKLYNNGNIDKIILDNEHFFNEHLKNVQGNIYIVSRKNLSSIKFVDQQPYIKLKVLSHFGLIENEYKNLNNFNI